MNVTLNCSSDEMTTLWGRASSAETLLVIESPSEVELESMMLMATTGARCFSWISLANWAFTASTSRLAAVRYKRMVKTIRFNHIFNSDIELIQLFIYWSSLFCVPIILIHIIKQTNRQTWRTAGYSEIKDTNGAAVGTRPQSRGRMRRVIRNVCPNEKNTADHATHAVIRYPRFNLTFNRPHFGCSRRSWRGTRSHLLTVSM